MPIKAREAARLYYGAYKSAGRKKIWHYSKHFSLSFRVLHLMAKLPGYSGKYVLDAKRQTHQSFDLQIAAIALANDFVLVTHTTGEFSRIAGLKLEVVA